MTHQSHQSHRRPPRLSVLLAGGAAALVLTGVSACGGSGGSTAPVPGAPRASGAGTPSGTSGLPAALVERTDKAYRDAGSPTDEVPTLDPEDECPLHVDTQVAGKKNESDGAGVSTIGSSGHRVVCEGTEPSTTFSVGHFTSAGELSELESSSGAQTEAGNQQTGSTETVGNRTFTVVRTSYPTNDSHIDYTVTITDRGQLAYAVLQVETTDEARQTYNSAQAARDLAAMLDSAA